MQARTINPHFFNVRDENTMRMRMLSVFIEIYHAQVHIFFGLNQRMKEYSIILCLIDMRTARTVESIIKFTHAHRHPP